MELRRRGATGGRAGTTPRLARGGGERTQVRCGRRRHGERAPEFGGRSAARTGRRPVSLVIIHLAARGAPRSAVGFRKAPLQRKNVKALHHPRAAVPGTTRDCATPIRASTHPRPAVVSFRAVPQTTPRCAMAFAQTTGGSCHVFKVAPRSLAAKASSFASPVRVVSRPTATNDNFSQTIVAEFERGRGRGGRDGGRGTSHIGVNGWC